MNQGPPTGWAIQREESAERLRSLAGLGVVAERARAKGLWRRVEELLAGPGCGGG